ncbi:hypothetical protein PHYPSEUDO_013261 [Phytophthora pseudosyringae]|uniref:Histone-lysine N-methyltransferase n=1 Tax=Phytophthora pseudosyringae TaxID=221518 RepID=A0A8T1W8H2_9STRA|nr:hypothetical protein PHYPSEUDO_013261 [Phytophthora pseudosyringae]
MKKKLRVATTRSPPASFAAALEVLFAPSRGLWRCINVESTLTLARVCTASRRALRAWLDAAAADLSLGKETLPVLMQLPGTTFHAQLHAALQLLHDFTYATSVQLPDGHKLPAGLQQKDDEQCQRVLRGRQVQVIVAQCKGKGWGVLAAQQIEQGAFVGEYTGELVSSREMRRRYRERYDAQELNYVLSLREHVARRDSAALHFDVVRTNVDATGVGSLTRFFNHSCRPTTFVAAVRVDSFVPRLALFARRCIETGEELTFDYGDGTSGADSQGGGGHPCRCGAPECRGYLPGGSGS